MQAVQEKPRLSYAAFIAQQKVQGPKLGSLIERFVVEMDGLGGQPPVRMLGESHRFTLRRLQRTKIASIVASEFTKQDVIEFAKQRRQEGVQASTVFQDLTYLSGVLKYAGSAWDGCEEVSDSAIAAAKPFLTKHGIIGKSVPRDRRPTSEEIYRLIVYFSTPPRRGKQRRIDMVLMTLWQLYSGRRVGESCALLWEDWNREDQTILVRKMKDPKRRGKSKVVALTVEAQALLVAMCDVRDPYEPRILPYNKKSVSAAYTIAKKRLGIENLRLHDSRRDVTSRLLESGYTSEQVILVTGHENTSGAFRVYAKPNPSTFKNGPRAVA